MFYMIVLIQTGILKPRWFIFMLQFGNPNISQEYRLYLFLALPPYADVGLFN